MRQTLNYWEKHIALLCTPCFKQDKFCKATVLPSPETWLFICACEWKHSGEKRKSYFKKWKVKQENNNNNFQDKEWSWSWKTNFAFGIPILKCNDLLHNVTRKRRLIRISRYLQSKCNKIEEKHQGQILSGWYSVVPETQIRSAW